MYKNFLSRSSFAKKLLVASAILSVGSITNVASAHEWTLKLDGYQQHIEASVVNFDGQQVLLEASNGAQKAFPVSQLNDSDMHYLKDIVVARQAVAQTKMMRKQLQTEQSQLQVERNELRLGYSDIWAVQLVAPNGSSIVRRYFATDTRQASAFALRDFPNARVGAMRRVNSRGSRNSRFF